MIRLAAAYVLFAVLAIGVNLLVQALVTAIDPTPLRFWTALTAGTGAGLITKYLLDKQYVFRARSLSGVGELGRSFLRYAATGLLTTAVFWSFQIAFHHGSAWEHSKYVGGALGLAIGYFWKYRLDRRYAFAEPENP